MDVGMLWRWRDKVEIVGGELERFAEPCGGVRWKEMNRKAVWVFV
jgi:hypothetical protein